MLRDDLLILAPHLWVVDLHKKLWDAFPDHGE